MNEEDIIIADPPEEDTTPDQPPTDSRPTPEPLSEAEKLEIARQYVQSNPDEFSHYYTTPQPKTEAQPTLIEDPMVEITDEYGNVDPKKLTSFLAKRDKANSESVMQGMTNLLAPVLQGFATQTAVQGLPEEAIPFAHDICNSLGVPLYQAANDPKTMEFVRSAAIGKAYQAGKLQVQMPEGAEPVGGGSRSSLSQRQLANLANYSRIAGRQITAKEAEDLRLSGVLDG